MPLTKKETYINKLNKVKLRIGDVHFFIANQWKYGILLIFWKIDDI